MSKWWAVRGDRSQRLLVTDREELREIPQWARVAFAARCARRVQPLYRTSLPPDLSAQQANEIETMIAAAEAAARHGQPNPRADHWHSPGIFEAPGPRGEDEQAHYIRAAAHAAVWATKPQEHGSGITLNAASIAAHSADTAAQIAQTEQMNRAAQWADLVLLRELSASERWTDATPVPVDLLGPLWPNGLPDWWPDEPVGGVTPLLHLEFTVPSEMSKRSADRLIGEILQRANELHHALGGTGLTISGAEVHECEPALVPAGPCEDDGGTP